MEQGGIYELDLHNVRTKDEFHDLIISNIPCHSYYGRNLDALYDILTEPSGMVKELIFRNYEEFSKAMPDYWIALKTLCGEATEQNHIIIRFEK